MAHPLGGLPLFLSAFFMRKFIIVASSFTLLAGIMLPFTEASRYAYHAYTQNSAQYKRYSGRVSPYNYGRRIKSRNFHGPSNYWDTYKADAYKTYPQKYSYSRVSQSKVQTPRLIKSRQNNIFPSYKYLASVPTSFQKDAQGNYKDSKSTLAFRVVQTPEKYHCYKKSLTLCAIDQGKGFKNEQSLSQTHTYFRSSRLHNTDLGSFQKYPVFVESFTGRLFGSENAYFIFNALNPSDRSIIRIEAVVSEKEKAKAAQTMFKIFESFRIKN